MNAWIGKLIYSLGASLLSHLELSSLHVEEQTTSH